jgi:endonuclease-3
LDDRRQLHEATQASRLQVENIVPRKSTTLASETPRTQSIARPVVQRTFRSRTLPFDIDAMIRLIRTAVADQPKPVLFELAERGMGSPFEILIACIITIRTLEEVSLPTSLRLLEVARTPEQIAKLTPRRIDDLIHACTFHEPKSRTIHAIARRIVKEFNGQLPCDFETLTSFSGVGPKCANLVLGIACNQPDAGGGIPVDIHVHRVTNRWGYVEAATPEKTMAALEAKLPRKYWTEINKLMVPFGKFVCTGKMPKCSTCPVLAYCRQVGVTAQR